MTGMFRWKMPAGLLIAACWYWGMTVACGAQPCDGVELPWLCTTPQLTGDWWGARSGLAESGITFVGDNTGFFFGNTVGGARRDFDYSGHGDYIFNVDAGKLGLCDGLFVKVRAEHRYGETIEQDVGSFYSPTILTELPVAASNQLYLTNLLFKQMLSDSIAVFAGKLDTLDGDQNAFAHGRGKTQFSNLGFVFNPITAATVPYSTLGAGFVVLDEGEPVFDFSVLNSTDTTGTSGFDQLFNDGVLLSAAIRLPTEFFGLPGHQLFGGTWNSRTYDSISEAYVQYPDLVIPTERECWSLYWNFDQYLVVDADNPARGWGVFGRAGIADDTTNPLAWFLSFGFGGNCMLDSRPDDTFGAGWYYAGLSNQISPYLVAAVGPIGDGQAVECFYNFQVSPAVRITPDLQVIVPAQRSFDPALAIGLRAQLIF